MKNKSITRALIAVAADGDRARIQALTLRIVQGESQAVAAQRAGVSRGVLVRLEKRLKKAGAVLSGAERTKAGSEAEPSIARQRSEVTGEERKVG